MYKRQVKDILVAIDAEIARLEQAKALLSTSGAFVAKRKPGRPAKVASIEAPKVQKARKRSKMSAEGRERIRHAQIKRWATLKLSLIHISPRHKYLEPDRQKAYGQGQVAVHRCR